MIGLRRGLVRGARISALGVHVPERVLTNDEISRSLDTSDEWITTRTGIRERRISHVPLTQLAHVAAARAGRTGRWPGAIGTRCVAFAGRETAGVAGRRGRSPRRLSGAAHHARRYGGHRGPDPYAGPGWRLGHP